MGKASKFANPGQGRESSHDGKLRIVTGHGSKKSSDRLQRAVKIGSGLLPSIMRAHLIHFLSSLPIPRYISAVPVGVLRDTNGYNRDGGGRRLKRSRKKGTFGACFCPF